MPLEVAVAKHDEVARLLVVLGAELNLPTQYSLNDFGRNSQFTILDYLRVASSEVNEVVTRKKVEDGSLEDNEDDHSAPPAGAHTIEDKGSVADDPAWKTEIRRLVLEFEASSTVQANIAAQVKQQNAHHLDETKEYIDELATLMVAHDAKSSVEVFRAAQSSNNVLEKLRENINVINPYADAYVRGARRAKFHKHGFGPCQDLASQYEELYTACWTGDDAKIKQLCLPNDAEQSSNAPLQISVHWGDGSSGRLCGLEYAWSALMKIYSQVSHPSFWRYTIDIGEQPN